MGKFVISLFSLDNLLVLHQQLFFLHRAHILTLNTFLRLIETHISHA